MVVPDYRTGRRPRSAIVRLFVRAPELGLSLVPLNRARKMLTLAASVMLVAASAAAADSTLGEVKERGYLKCGVLAGYEGFASTDQYGEWHGFDTDFCRAVATAVVGDPRMVMFVSADRQAGIDSLASGGADLVARGAVGLGGLGGAGARQVGVLLHDGYGFMVPAGSAVQAPADLAGRRVCTTSVRGAAEALRAELDSQGVEAELVDADNLREPLTRYTQGECAALSALRSDLAGMRTFIGGPSAHRLLEAEFGKAPAGPRVRGGDKEWAALVQWVLFALIEAEELGITRENVDEMKASSASGRVRQLLGAEADTGGMLGLSPDWAHDIVKQVGSYAEIYARNIGPHTPLALPRTRSRLWNAGGMLFAPPAVAR